MIPTPSVIVVCHQPVPCLYLALQLCLGMVCSKNSFIAENMTICYNYFVWKHVQLIFGTGTTLSNCRIFNFYDTHRLPMSFPELWIMPVDLWMAP